VTESTKIPNLSPLATTSFQAPRTPRMWVWRWPSMHFSVHSVQWSTTNNFNK